jgi:hypothetical protein
MPENTARLALPFIMAAQAQKHITHNDALRLLDGIVQLSVLDKDLTTPPGSPADGAAYIVPAGATGVWAGWSGDVAYRADGAWLRLVAGAGWRAFVADEGAVYLRTASGWVAMLRAQEVALARGPLGATTGMGVLEETLSGLSGATRDSTIQIPDRAICLGVSTRTVTTVTGATSFNCGIAGQASKFGATLGVAAGSTNRGVIGPEAFYAPTSIRLTANGGNFTGGSVRIAIHYLTVGLPS